MSLDLNCAMLIDEGKSISIPPENAKRYPEDIRRESLKEYIKQGGEILVIQAENGRNPRKQQENLEK